MFGLKKTKNPYAQGAYAAYGAILNRVRSPAFYTDFGVPDTQEARFDMLLLHLFMVMHVLLGQKTPGAESFNQALFDATFADMDQGLREVGIGDTGIPKRMKRMMKAFNGRTHAYQNAAEGTEDLADVLRRNLFSGVQNPDVARMKNYVQRSVDLLQQQPPEEIMAGNIIFADTNAV
jgi:cytochrome b pre-mRNA-processing protein 3